MLYDHDYSFKILELLIEIQRMIIDGIRVRFNFIN